MIRAGRLWTIVLPGVPYTECSTKYALRKRGTFRPFPGGASDAAPVSAQRPGHSNADSFEERPGAAEGAETSGDRTEPDGTEKNDDSTQFNERIFPLESGNR